MPKKIYIIKAKLSPERIRYLTEILEHKSKEYKQVPACNIADYIVTELKSPSRIIRNVKKSTCPVVHISWLLESLQSEKPLNITNYLIDVTEERKKASLQLSRRVDVDALPQQLTWEEVATRRLNKSNHIFGQKEKLIKNSAIQERSLFKRSYNGRYKSSTTANSQPIYSISLNSRVQIPTDSTTIDDSFSNSEGAKDKSVIFPNCSNSTAINALNLENYNDTLIKSASSLSNEFKYTKIEKSSSLSLTQLETKVSSVVRFPLTSKKINTSSRKKKVEKKKEFSKSNYHTVDITDSIVITDSEDEFDELGTTNVEDKLGFSIASSYKPALNENGHIPRNSQSCSIEEITSHEEVTCNNSQDNNYSSISSMDSQFSISKILSL